MSKANVYDARVAGILGYQRIRRFGNAWVGVKGANITRVSAGLYLHYWLADWTACRNGQAELSELMDMVRVGADVIL